MLLKYREFILKITITNEHSEEEGLFVKPNNSEVNIRITTKRIICEINMRFFASPPTGGFAQNDRYLCFWGGGGWRHSRQPPPPTP